jgi:signal peptidase I
MVPALWPGDLVTVRSCDTKALAPHSILVFRQNQRLIVHRLMRRDGDRILARGDARPRFDEPIVPAQIVGCVEAVTRNGRLIDLRPSLWQKAVASVLRRSEWCTWFFLRLSSRIRGFATAGAPWGV